MSSLSFFILRNLHEDSPIQFPLIAARNLRVASPCRGYFQANTCYDLWVFIRFSEGRLMAEKIVGNFTVRTVQGSTRPGEWTSTFFVSRLDAKLGDNWVLRETVVATFDNPNAAAQIALDAGVRAASQLSPDARPRSRTRG
jgi:hypothetical protein